MNDKNTAIRFERPEDHRAVENLIRESFWNVRHRRDTTLMILNDDKSSHTGAVRELFVIRDNSF